MAPKQNVLKQAPIESMRAEGSVHLGTLAQGLLAMASFKDDHHVRTQDTAPQLHLPLVGDLGQPGPFRDFLKKPRSQRKKHKVQ